MMPKIDRFYSNAFDKFIGAQLNLVLQDVMPSMTVVARKKDMESNPVNQMQHPPQHTYQ
jgi:hypothetical protein